MKEIFVLQKLAENQFLNWRYVSNTPSVVSTLLKNLSLETEHFWIRNQRILEDDTGA
jgi:hypothetical protein